MIFLSTTSYVHSASRNTVFEQKPIMVVVAVGFHGRTNGL